MRIRKLMRLITRYPKAAAAILLAAIIGGILFWTVLLPTYQANAAYTIQKSLRFNDDDTSYLSRTFGSGDRKTWTYSFWMKRGNLGSSQYVLSTANGGSSDTTFMRMGFDSTDDKFYILGWSSTWRKTTQVFRDPSAWYHIVVTWDTTQATAVDRIKLYVNGSQVTAFDTTTNPTQNTDYAVNQAVAHRIAHDTLNAGTYFDGYMSDVYLIDGQALTPSDFAETDATTGSWKAKAYTGSYGTNGFHLDFTDSATLGNDVSGNNNDWTSNNLDATDQVRDTPTNNYGTLTSISSSGGTMSQGNLLRTATTNNVTTHGTFPIPATGKWYWEVTLGSMPASHRVHTGIVHSSLAPATVENDSRTTSGDPRRYQYITDSNQDASSGFGGGGSTTFSLGNVAWSNNTIMVAYDASAGAIWFGKDCVWYPATGGGAAGDPSAGTNPARSSITPDMYVPSVYSGGGTSAVPTTMNFGQSANPTSTATTLPYRSAAGGNFLCTPPTGFKALSTQNLPTTTISNPKNYFDAIAYAGTGAAQFIGTNISRFTTTGTTTWTAPQGVTSVEYLVVAGGGGGGRRASGGGGAGGVRMGTVAVTPGTTYSVVVGAGGAGSGSDSVLGGKGGHSTFGSISASGGGGGNSGSSYSAAGSGGSGGGSGDSGTAAGSGNQGGYTPAEGFAGGSSSCGGGPGGGGGGAGGAGNGCSGSQGGDGGVGTTSAITGATTYYGGGGGGSSDGTATAGGLGGGGAGSTGTSDGGDATANTGGGGGAARANGGGAGTGGDGGSGIVIVKYTPNANTFGFTPALTWIKDRTNTQVHGLFDSVRKLFPYLSSNSTAAETASITALTSFDSTGFSLGTNSLFNTNTNNYISWNWLESITSGFDIVTYSGNSTNRTIAHSLGSAPEMMIVKVLSDTDDWPVYHVANTSAPETDYLFLNSTAATADSDLMWNDTAPTGSVFTVGTSDRVNATGKNYVAYLFNEIPGYSKFGSYTGNSSADGPFVYTGFKPKYVLIKSATSASGHWQIYDAARSTYNEANHNFRGNLTNAEDTSVAGLDFLSNGFKLRNTCVTHEINCSGDTHVYAAFAEQPFQQSAQPYNLTIASSTRTVSGRTTYLTRTPASAGDRKTWTASFWHKRSALGVTYQALFPQAGTAGAAQGLSFNGSDQLVFDYTNNNTALKSNAVFRDPSKWMHIVVRLDTTQASASDRMRIWVDNNEITSWATDARSTAFSQNSDQSISNTIIHTLGVYSGSINSIYVPDGYFSDVYFIGGQALSPTDFGEYDTNGNWRPKTYSGSYGTNGFHLPLMGTTSAASLGTDTSGNGNSWTSSGFDTTDFVKDSPTNNFGTLNSVGNRTTTAPTLSNGNLNVTIGSADVGTTGTFGLTSGKWYWEYSASAVAGTCGTILGVTSDALPSSAISNYRIWRSVDGQVTSSQITSCAAWTAYGSSATTNDVIGVALDMDNGKLFFSKNGTWYNSGDPAAGTNAAFTDLSGKEWRPFWTIANNSTNTGVFNFGQSAFPTSTATRNPYRSSAGGYFLYTPPTGFTALSTANLPVPTITKPNNYFEAKTYTGTGAALSVSGLNFTPTLTWIKDRTSANAHGIFDSVRGVFPYLSTDGLGAETASSTTLTGFGSNGFSLGASSFFNRSGSNFISWNWKEDPVSGFDIVSYTGTGSAHTEAHSLGVAPKFIMIRNRTSGNSNWPVYHESVGNTKAMYLNSSGTGSVSSVWFNNTSPTASVFTVGTDVDINASGVPYIAYVFSEVPGYSKFGSYTGNGSADGPFVYTGFKPKYIMVRNGAAAASWRMYDTSRQSYNENKIPLLANATNADSAEANGIDILSNGFKIRWSDSVINGSGNQHIYAAFAEAPFKYATAGATLGNLAPFIFYEF